MSTALPKATASNPGTSSQPTMMILLSNSSWSSPESLGTISCVGGCAWLAVNTAMALVGEEVVAATVVVQGNTIKNVLPGVVQVPG